MKEKKIPIVGLPSWHTAPLINNSMKLAEAKYQVQKPDMRHVYEVSKMYSKFASNGWDATMAGVRPSDYELWNSGRPVINIFGTMSDGFTGLKFIFQSKSEDDARRWVRDFLTSYGLPHTSIETFPPYGVPGMQIDADGHWGEPQPTYTRVDVRYQEDPSNA